MAISKGYLDTCIVSGLVKSDLRADEEMALRRILKARDLGAIEIVTSEVTKAELNRIPSQHRARHIEAFTLLAKVPTAPTLIGSSRFIGGPNVTVLTAGWREDPLLGQLRNLLPDPEDADHAFQAAQNGAGYLITVDRATFLKYAAQVAQLCEVRLVTPVQFEQCILNPLGSA